METNNEFKMNIQQLVAEGVIVFDETYSESERGILIDVLERV